jgi:hypothetical protein
MNETNKAIILKALEEYRESAAILTDLNELAEFILSRLEAGSAIDTMIGSRHEPQDDD